MFHVFASKIFLPRLVRLVRLLVEDESIKHIKWPQRMLSLRFNSWNVNYFLHIKVEYKSVSYVANKLLAILKKIEK